MKSARITVLQSLLSLSVVFLDAGPVRQSPFVLRSTLVLSAVFPK